MQINCKGMRCYSHIVAFAIVLIIYLHQFRTAISIVTVTKFTIYITVLICDLQLLDKQQGLRFHKDMKNGVEVLKKVAFEHDS